jgi:glycerol-3-phosphate O-acyltransferase 1/2
MNSHETLEPRPSIINLRMIGFARRNEIRASQRRSEEQYRENRLFLIKTDPLYKLRSKPVRKNNTLACNTCTPFSNKFAVKPSLGCLDVQNAALVQGNGNFFKKQFRHIIYCWNINRFQYPQISQEIISNDRVKLAMKATCLREKQNTKVSSNGTKSSKQDEKKYKNQAIEIFQTIASKISDRLLKLITWASFKAFPLIFKGILVRPVQMIQVQNASKQGLPIVFFPLHRSLLDHILISFILVSFGIKAPLVALREVNITLINWLLRLSGVFCMKSKSDPDYQHPLYHAVLHSYVIENLKTGQPMEFFLEGDCNPSGKTCIPESDMVNLLTNTLMDSSVKHAMIVPVSINYERPIDDSFDLNMQRNTKSWRLVAFIRAIWAVFQSNYGMIRVDFGQPFSLAEFNESFEALMTLRYKRSNKSQNTQPPRNSARTGLQQHTAQYSSGICYSKAEYLARHILFDCDKNMPIMSTNAVAFILLHQFRNGTTLPKLASALEDLRLDVKVSNRDVGFSGESTDVLNHALRLLGPQLVHVETSSENVTFVKPIIEMPSVIELSYFANGVKSLFVAEAVIATAMCCLQEKSTWSNSSKCFMSRCGLLEKALEICHILQFEFMFAKPCQLVSNVMALTIDNFATKGVLIEERDMIAEDLGEYRRHYTTGHMNIDSGDSDDYVPQELNYYGSDEYKPMIQVLISILRPILETYVACAESLHCLLSTDRTESDLRTKIRLKAEACLQEGDALYQESLSTAPITNALRLFKQWNVIDYHTHDGENIYYLTNAYNNFSDVRSVCKIFSALLSNVD